MKPTADLDSKLAQLVERQMRNWELARRQRAVTEPQKRKEVEDFICISREVGVGASPIGEKLSARLGWPVFDKDILGRMAGDDHVREAIYASLDERDAGWCENMLRSLMEPSLRDDYVHNLRKTILTLARQGSAVFIGRGAELILPRKLGLRARLIAPLEMRIQHFAARRGISAKDARKEVQHLEDERARYIRHYFNADVNDSGRFDLVINLERITADGVAELIISAHKLLAAGQTH